MKRYHVYAIINLRTHDAYIGCSQQLGSRVSQHLKHLAEGTHHSSKLQKAWKRYGREAFQAAVLLDLGSISRETAASIEAIWIGKLGTYNEVGTDGWSDTMRDNHSERMREQWSDPVRRVVHSKQLKALWADPDRRKAYASRRTRWDDPEQNSQHSEQMKSLWADPERRQKLEARRAARWADPEAKARQGEKMRAYHAARRARLPGV